MTLNFKNWLKKRKYDEILNHADTGVNKGFIWISRQTWFKLLLQNFANSLITATMILGFLWAFGFLRR